MSRVAIGKYTSVLIGLLVLGLAACIVRWAMSYRITSNLEREVGFPHIFLTDRYASEEFVSEQLKKPRGIAVDQDGLVYVSDEELCAVLVFSPQGDPVRKIGGIGSRPGEFLSPKGITINDNRLYVADYGNQRIVVLTTAGDLVQEISLSERQLNPLDLAVVEDGIYFTVWATSADVHRIYRVSNDGRVSSYGKRLRGYLAEIDSTKAAFANELVFPTGSSMWINGMKTKVWAEAGENEVSLVDGKLTRAFELPYKYQPRDFVYSPTSQTYYFISGAYNDIDCFSKDGEYLGTVLDGSLGSENKLEYIALARDGTLYCTAPNRGRVYRVRPVQ